MPGLRLVLSRCQQESVASLVQHGLMWRGCESATLLPAPSYPARVGVEGQAGGGTKRPVQDRSSDLDEKLPADQTLPTAAVRAGKSESQASTFQAGAAAAINTGKAAISIFPRVLSRLLERLFHLATIPAIIRDWDVGISHRTARAWHSFLIYAMRRSGASLLPPCSACCAPVPYGRTNHTLNVLASTT